MEIQIVSSGLPLSSSLRDHAERSLRSALACDGGRVRRALVRLVQLETASGGGKRCEIEIVLNEFASIAYTEADIYVAIDRAAARAGREVARRAGTQGDPPRRGDFDHSAPAAARIVG
jgi:hypothetical protein